MNSNFITQLDIKTQIKELLDELELLTQKAETGEQWAEIARLEKEIVELKKDSDWLAFKQARDPR